MEQGNRFSRYCVPNGQRLILSSTQPWSGTKGQLRRRGPGISEQYRAPPTNTSPLSPWPGKWAPGPTPSHPDDSQHPFDMARAQSLGGASINMEGRTTW